MERAGGRLGLASFFLALCDNCHVSQTDSVSMVTLDETAALFLHSIDRTKVYESEKKKKPKQRTETD